MSSSLAPVLALPLPATLGRCQPPRTAAELGRSGQSVGPNAFVCWDLARARQGDPSEETIHSSGQGGGDADLRGQSLMHRATLGDVEQSLSLGVIEVAGQLDAAINLVDVAIGGFAVGTVL